MDTRIISPAILPVAIIFAVFISAGLFSSCMQEELIGIADGVPVIYALADKAGIGTLIVAADSGYSREYAITGLPTPSTTDQVFADKDNTVFAAHFTDLYFTRMDELSETWNSYPLGSTVLDIESLNSETIFLVQNTADCLYRFDEDSGSCVSMGKNITNTPEFMSLDPHSNTVFVSDNTGGNSNIWYLTSAPALVFKILVPATPARNYFAVIDGNCFIGNDTSGLYVNSSGTPVGAGASMQSYAFLGGDAFYAADDNEIFRLNKSTSTFESVFSGFADTGNSIELAAFDKENLAVGVYKSPSGPDNGLYLYNTKKGSLKRLSSLMVAALYVKR